MLRWIESLGLAALALVASCGRGDSGAAQQQARATPAPITIPGQPISTAPSRTAARPNEIDRQSNIGFRSRAQFDEHFQKHGAEFGRITQQEYLRAAQSLRDAPVGANIEEIRRDDGTTSRFDRSTGAFLAFNRDGTIRTFFKPNDGEAYFRRQAARVH